jgi:hypothetical protein
MTLMTGERNSYSVLVEKPEGKRPLRKARLKWEDNIKTDIKIRIVGMDWRILLQDSDKSWDLEKTVIDIRL